MEAFKFTKIQCGVQKIANPTVFCTCTATEWKEVKERSNWCKETSHAHIHMYSPHVLYNTIQYNIIYS